jgi:hypothetical protein
MGSVCKKWHVPRVALNGGAGESGQRKDRGVSRMAGGKAEKAERRERQSDVGRTEWKSVLKKCPNAPQMYRDGNKVNELHPDPQLRSALVRRRGIQHRLFNALSLWVPAIVPRGFAVVSEGDQW